MLVKVFSCIISGCGGTRKHGDLRVLEDSFQLGGPDDDALVCGARGKPLLILSRRHAVNRVLVALQGLHQRPIIRIIHLQFKIRFQIDFPIYSNFRGYDASHTIMTILTGKAIIHVCHFKIISNNQPL